MKKTISYRYDKLKKVIERGGEEEVLLTQDVYDIKDGAYQKTTEQPFNPSVIPDRVAALQKEIKELQELQDRIAKDDFDEVVDKRVQIKE